MNGLITIILTFFLTTTCGVAYFSHLPHDQQQSVQNWISENTPSIPSVPSIPSTPYTPPEAPEIDEVSGTAAIALLAGVLLLAGERSRYRRF